MSLQHWSSNPTVKAGLTVGIALGTLTLIVTTLYDFGVVPQAVEAVEYVLVVAGLFTAGLMAARQVRQAKSGLLAGIIASVLPAIILLGSNVLMAIVAPNTFATFFGYHDVTPGQMVMASALQSLAGLVLWAVIGAILGVVGGLIGRGRAARTASA